MGAQGALIPFTTIFLAIYAPVETYVSLPNLGNLWRRLVLPRCINSWSLTSLQQRLVKTGGRLVRHARYYWLLLAESRLTRRRSGRCSSGSRRYRFQPADGDRLATVWVRRGRKTARCLPECRGIGPSAMVRVGGGFYNARSRRQKNSDPSAVWWNRMRPIKVVKSEISVKWSCAARDVAFDLVF
jgi:hypothetical protein